jgi:hypothetical protein
MHLNMFDGNDAAKVHADFKNNDSEDYSVN